MKSKKNLKAANGNLLLQSAALATADLAQPVRLISGETGGFILQTAKGENTPACVTDQSISKITKYIEDILKVVDREVAASQYEDSIPIDMLSAPDWFGPYKYQSAFYRLDDVSLQLDPNKSKTLLDPIFKAWISPPEHLDLHSPKIQELRAILDAKCNQGLSCAYRLRYPHVGSAGPVALSPVVLSLLTKGATLAAVNNASMEGLLSAVLSVLLPDITDEMNTTTDDSQFSCPQMSLSWSITPDYCICCILTRQTRSYIEASSEVCYSEDPTGLLTTVTFIGVMKTQMAKEGFLKIEVDYFSPVVNIHKQEKCYMADCLPFSEYNLTSRLVDGDKLWLVERSATNDYRSMRVRERMGNLIGI